MRVLLACAVACAVAAAGSAAVDAGTVQPRLRVGGDPVLTVIGSGFPGRASVRVHVTGPGIDRRVAVRAGVRGVFAVRFVGLARCAPREITAVTPSGARARVPAPWFVRECPPPPPLDPGTPPVS